MSEINMHIIENISEMRSRRATWQGKTIGFVPTMGALHEGHYTLVNRARKECDVVVTSIFVNPTQFNDPSDLEKYPRTLENDLAGLRAVGCDEVFLPKPSEIYHDNYRFEVREKEISRLLCGAHRPGHFEGVLTVVLKLFQLVRPQKAYFGEKDYQQLKLIQDMSQSLFLDVEVVPCATVRERDGLAMSSRNLRLSSPEREMAPKFFRILSTASSVEGARTELEAAGFKIDYVEEQWGRRFGAVFLGNVRLIDNVEI